MESLITLTLSNSLLAAALVIVALAVSRLVKKKPAVAHVLWLLVLVKLVTPPLFSVPVSWPEPARLAAGRVTSADPAPVVGVDISAIEQQLTELRAEQSKRTESLQWPEILACIWLFGSVLWLFYAMFRIRQFNQLLKTAQPAAEQLQTKTLYLARQMGMRRSPHVLLIDAEVPPMVWCVGWTPRIFLPTTLAAAISAQQLELIVTHELAHVKRRDYLMRWFELMVLVVYWWNPIAWLAVRSLRTAEELCCDAMVVELNSANARSYVETLIQVVDFLAEKRSIPSLASGIGSSPLLIRRCEMILTDNTSSHVGRLTCLLILAMGITVLPFSVQSRAQDDSSSDLEKRITRLEKLIENLRKALNSNVPSDQKAAVDLLEGYPSEPTPFLGFLPEVSTPTSDKREHKVTQPAFLGFLPKVSAPASDKREHRVNQLQKKADQLRAELRSIERQIKEAQKPSTGGFNQDQLKMLDALKQLNQQRSESAGDPKIETRIKHYERAFRIQAFLQEVVPSASPELLRQIKIAIEQAIREGK